MMKILPTLETVKEYSQTGLYDVVPVYCEILSDFCTPIEAMKVLKNASNHCFLLESAAANEKWGRYTFLGFDPKLVITCSNMEMQIQGAVKPGESGIGNGCRRVIAASNPETEIRRILSFYRSPRLEGLPSFTGGMVGYFAYDYMFYSEPTAKRDVEDVEKFNDVDLMLFDKVIAFDNFRQKLIVIVNMPLTDVETEYAKAEKRLEEIVSLLKTGDKWQPTESRVTSPATPLFDKERYCDMVRKAQKHIYEGDIFQIVLSNCLSMDFDGSLFNAYRYLRTINPSPYMFYLSGTDVEIAGSSPETLVKLEDGILHTFPLAGTRPRGKTDVEDKRLEAELLADEKELAEHNMLVDLGRNDLGKISKFGSVEVEKLHSIERYSHVMHIGSTVRGEIQEKYDALDAIRAVLPAGTLSGAPKIRACQLIGELEQNKRGIYGGAIGYIDFTGSMDVCISIRIAYKKNGKAFVRSGAGIVADSIPEKEFQECVNKAAAIVDSLNNCNL